MRKQWIPGSLFPAHREPGYETTEPFPLADLRPAPNLLTALANILQYIIKHHEVEHLWHYLHNNRKFFFVYPALQKGISFSVSVSLCSSQLYC